MGTSPEHATSYPDEATMSEPLLTGPAAASLLGLDGFRDHVWQSMWLNPHTVSAAPGIIRTRSREPLGPSSSPERGLHLSRRSSRTWVTYR